MKKEITTTSKMSFGDFKRLLDSIVKWSFEGWGISAKDAACYVHVSKCFRFAVAKWDGHMSYDMRGTVKMNLYSMAYNQYLNA